MDQIKIKAEPRTEQGTGAVRRLRKSGMIPGSVMKMKKGGTELIKLPAHDFMMAMRGHASKQLLVTLDMDGKEVPALMREMQNDVLAGTPIHVDFSEVSLTEKVRVTVPLYLVGEAVGVKLGGGVLEQTLRTIDVLCLPTDIAHQPQRRRDALRARPAARRQADDRHASGDSGCGRQGAGRRAGDGGRGGRGEGA